MNSGRRWFHNPALVAAAILALTLVAYIPAMRGGFIWDDDYYVTGNFTLRDAEGLRRIWLDITSPADYPLPQYYPLTHTTFWVEYHLWQLNPLGYHLDNVLLHAANAILLWILLSKLGFDWAWWAAAIFALHPMQVESVAWVTERKNVLSGFFYLLAAITYVRFAGLDRPEPADPGAERRRWGLYALAIALFTCALFSKTVTATLPAAMLLIIWWKRGRIRWRDMLPLAPLLVMGFAMGRLTAWMEIHRVGAHGPEWDFTWLDRVFIAGRAIWFYAGKLLWPHPLIFFYRRWTLDPGQWWQYLFPAGAMAAVAALWLLRRRIGRGPLVGTLFFVGTLFPALGFANVFPMLYSFVADHFQYLASIGMICLAVAVVGTSLRRVSSHPSAVAAVLCPVLLALGVLTWRQGHVYKNLETLWRDTIARNDQAWSAHNNLGLLLFSQWRLKEAEACYRAGLGINPQEPRLHFNLGNLLTRTGRAQEAIGHLRRAVQLAPDIPDSRVFLGNALAAMGHLDQARQWYESALEIQPEFESAWLSYGDALADAGRDAEAAGKYAQALENDPHSCSAHLAMGKLLLKAGRYREAVDPLTQAVESDPQHAVAHNTLGMALGQLGDLGGAEAEFRKAVELAPNLVEAHNNLGSVLRERRAYAEAVQHLEEALKLKPDFALARQNLQRTMSEWRASAGAQ